MSFKQFQIVFLIIILTIFTIPAPIQAQIVQPGKVIPSTNNCYSVVTQTAGQTAFLTVDPHGDLCIVNAPTSYSSGLGITNLVSGATPGTVGFFNIKASAGQLYGLAVDAGANTASTVVWMNFYDGTVAATTTGSTVLFSTPVWNGVGGARTIIPLASPIGIPFVTGLVYSCTTLKGGSVGTQVPCGGVSLTR